MAGSAFFMRSKWPHPVHRLARLVLGVLLWTWAAPALGAVPAAGPWAKGEQVDGAWLVHDVLTHEEFQRYTLARGTERAVVELIASEQPPGPWTTGRHKLQPGPASPPDPQLLSALMPKVRQWESQLPASRPAPIQTTQFRPPPRILQQIQDFTLQVLQGGGWLIGLAIWLGATAACWLRWLRRGDLGWVVTAAAVCAALAAWLSTWPLPTDWLHALHESMDIFPAVTAGLPTDGPLPEALRQLWPRHPQHWLALPGAAHQQVFVAAIALSFLAVWAQRRLPAAAVLALMAGLLCSPPIWRAVLSELPTSWLLMLGWSALAPTDLWQHDHRWRRLALVQLLATALAVLLIREELGVALLVGLALVHAGKKVNLDLPVQRAIQAVTATPQWIWGLAGIILVPLGLATDQIQSSLRWLLAGANPLHLSTFEAPLALATAASPVLVALLLWALVAAARMALAGRTEPLLLALLAMAMIKTYAGAAHGSYYEIQRYVGLLTPVWGACGVLAAAHLWQRAQPGSEMAGPRPHRRTIAAALALLALPPLPALGIWLPQASPVYAAPTDDPPAWRPLDRDRQREARFVLDTAAQYRECALVAKVVGVPGPRNFVENLLWTAVSPHHLQPVQVAERDGPQKALARLRFSHAAGVAVGQPAAPCVLTLRLLDCHRVEGVSCPPPPADASLVREQRWVSKPYLAAREHGAFLPEIHLQAWLQWQGGAARSAPGQGH